jgi:hypothetical protein
LFQQCGILELFQQCGILELFQQCGIFGFSFYWNIYRNKIISLYFSCNDCLLSAILL